MARCQPNSIERVIELECKWKGAPVSANLKWTEPKEDPTTISNVDDGSKKTISTKANTTTINKQQALMLTGASGAALAGGGLLVKKKLEGSDSPTSETHTASASKTATTS